MHSRLIILPAAAIFCLASASNGEDLQAQAARIMREASITYHTTFAWSCSESTWDRVADNPLLMGHLWKAYGFAPAYQLQTKREVIHVHDPTGLSGVVRAFSGSSGERIYLSEGKVDHWAVPFFNGGEAVFVLKSEREEGGVRGDLTVYIKSTSLVGDAVLTIGEPLLMKHIDNRITLNLQDAGKIVETIESRPENARDKLSGTQANRFEAVFLSE